MSLGVCVAAGVTTMTGLTLAITTAAGLAAEAWPPVAPPAPPPWMFQSEPDLPAAGDQPAEGESPAPYSIGQPTDEEQLYLEYINRARSDPPAEGIWLSALDNPDVQDAYRFFGVDTNLLVQQFNTNPPAPPLSFHPALIAAARGHSQDMYENVFQGHVSSNGDQMTDRIQAAGYPWNRAAENVYATADSVLHGHAAFNVDWGGDSSTGGMQSPPGHRNSILSPLFREVGIGVVLGSNTRVEGNLTYEVGPQLVTQDFGNRAGLTPFVTGVVYFDLNGNDFYDLGEGIGGIRVDVAGATSYAVTAVSGGYSVPVTANGIHNVTFSLGGQTLAQLPATVANLNSAKLDFVPDYQPPTITGAAEPAIGQSNHYTFNAVLGATNYEWQLAEFGLWTTVEGAENGTAEVSIASSPGYPVFESGVKYTGSYSFHLAHPAQEDQIIQFRRTFLPGANASVSFASRLGLASVDQIASVEVSTNQGADWTRIWFQNGDNSWGELQFSLRNVSLASFVGQEILIRFTYTLIGPYYPNVTDAGWYVDAITFADVEYQESASLQMTAGELEFSWIPSGSSHYRMQVRALLPGRILPFGPGFTANGVPYVPPLRLESLRNGNTLVLRWPTNYADHVLQSTATFSVPDSWGNAGLTREIQGTQYQSLAPLGSEPRYFRLKKP